MEVITNTNNIDMKATPYEHEMVREWISAILKNKQYDHLNPIEGAQKWLEQYRQKFGTYLPEVRVKVHIDEKEVSAILKGHKEMIASLESGE